VDVVGVADGVVMADGVVVAEPVTGAVVAGTTVVETTVVGATVVVLWNSPFDGIVRAPAESEHAFGAFPGGLQLRTGATPST